MFILKNLLTKYVREPAAAFLPLNRRLRLITFFVKKVHKGIPLSPNFNLLSFLTARQAATSTIAYLNITEKHE